MSKVVVTEREVRLARAFLAALGGNQTSGYLLLAIVAWQRLMKKARDPYWKKLAGLSAQAAGRALAAHLKALAAKHPSQYQGLMAALRRKPGSASGQLEQAKSFMLIIEKSGYDAKHYGYQPPDEGHWLTRDLPNGTQETIWVPPYPGVDPMLVQWAALTGHPIPPKWFQDTYRPPQPKPRPTPVYPHQPRSLQHVLPQPDYILPYAAEHFYNERPHLGNNILPAD